MRRIAISALSVFIVLPVMADVHLPTVNVGKTGVSARAAFGVSNVATRTTVASAPTVTSRATKNVVPVVREKSVDITSGESIARVDNDVLTPRRPSDDLWARSDNALRMPLPQEYSVLTSNAILPEESLEDKDTVAVAASVSDSVDKKTELDAQIARLVELQRRADAGVDAPVVASRVATAPTRVIAAPIADSVVDVPAKKKVASRNAMSVDKKDTGVTLSRMVVPMDNDVIVRKVEKKTSSRIAAVRDDMTKMTPSELRNAFRKTYLSENKHLSTFSVDDVFNVASDMSASVEGFAARRDLSESGDDVRTLEIKIKFRNNDSALSRDNYRLLEQYAELVLRNPTRAIQIAISQNVARSVDARRLAARRLAIIEQVLRDTGVSEQRIVPVLSSRNEAGFVLRVISNEQYETLTQKQSNVFGDTVGSKTYKSMTW